jgi:3-phenylpropionate/trans-cinnamate dioxygenase ferredoxin component
MRVVAYGTGASPGEARGHALSRFLGMNVEFHFVANVRDVPRGACRCFMVGGRGVLLCERDGRYYGLSPSCPHQGLPLDGARLWGDLIDCPWHHYQFDVKTGENAYPARLYPGDRSDLTIAFGNLVRYAVDVRGESVYVGFPTIV